MSKSDIPYLKSLNQTSHMSKSDINTFDTFIINVWMSDWHNLHRRAEICFTWEMGGTGKTCESLTKSLERHYLCNHFFALTALFVLTCRLMTSSTTRLSWGLVGIEEEEDDEDDDDIDFKMGKLPYSIFYSGFC